MSEKLLREDWEHLIPDEVGKQIHAHHCKQGKGNDKLYIKRLHNGSIAFCHHCHKRGFIPSTKLPARFIAKEVSLYGGNPSHKPVRSGIHDVRTEQDSTQEGQECRDDVGRVQFNLPRDCSSSLKQWDSPEPKVWLIQNGITEDDCKLYGIYWSSKLKALVFPAFTEEASGNALGSYQLRYFPKSYKSVKSKNGSTGSLATIGLGCISGGKIFLVEDYISAVRIAKLGQYAYPLRGSNMSDTQFAYLLTKGTKFGIMLDNDNIQVKKSQLQIKNRLEAHGKTVRLYSLEKDPKEYTDIELTKFIEEL